MILWQPVFFFLKVYIDTYSMRIQFVDQEIKVHLDICRALQLGACRQLSTMELEYIYPIHHQWHIILVTLAFKKQEI